MRSKSRFTTLALLDTRDLCAIALYASRPLSPGPRNICYQASGATPYSDRSSTGWIAPACLAHSFDHLVGAGRVAPKRWGCQAPFVLSWSPARTRGRSRAASAIGGSAASLNRPIAFDGGYHSSCLGARNVRLGQKHHFDQRRSLPILPGKRTFL